MTALQLRAPGEPLTPDGEAWRGASIEHLEEVLDCQLEAPQQFRELGGRRDDDVGGARELLGRLVRGDRDPHRELEPVDPRNASRSVVSSPA